MVMIASLIGVVSKTVLIYICLIEMVFLNTFKITSQPFICLLLRTLCLVPKLIFLNWVSISWVGIFESFMYSRHQSSVVYIYNWPRFFLSLYRLPFHTTDCFLCIQKFFFFKSMNLCCQLLTLCPGQPGSYLESPYLCQPLVAWFLPFPLPVFRVWAFTLRPLVHLELSFAQGKR